jgi:hypothetical protein
VSCDQLDEIGTLGFFAFMRARTQRARARRDQVGKNWRDSARVYAKPVRFSIFDVSFVEDIIALAPRRICRHPRSARESHF